MITADMKVILVDDDNDFRHALTQSLRLADYQVSPFESAQDVPSQISRDDCAVIVTDIRMEGVSGMELLKQVLDIDPALPVVVISGHGNISTAVEAMRKGAYDFIEKPFTVERLTNVVSRALEKRRLVLENRTLREKLDENAALNKIIVGSSTVIQELRSKVTALAHTDIDILVWGETGSGKEVVSRALHDEGLRKNKPFVALNCGAIPVNMIESELFGHESGAFTSANKKRIGKLEYANGGTVFLDEIESMPMELQIKLLRVIETRSIERLGSNQTIPLDVRFVAATKKDLKKASEANEFRADLYYRLNVVSIRIPPLRERRSDIPELSQHFSIQARARYRRDISELSPEMMEQLMSHDWPGNVRELRNVIDRITLGVWSGFDHLKSDEISTPINDGRPLAEKVGEFEAKLINAEIQKCNGSLKATYESLGISRKALYDKMKKYNIIKSTHDV